MFNINQNFALKSAELFNFERDAYRTTADLFGQPLTYFPDRFVVTVTSDGSRYQLDKSKAPSNKLTPTDTLSDAERKACWLPLPTVADKAAFSNYVGKSEIANMVTSTGLTGGTITIAAGNGKAVKSLANGSVGQILKIGTDGLKWADENTFTLSPPKDGNIGGVKPGSGLTVDTAGTLSIKLGSGLGFDTNGNVGILNALRLTDTTLNGNTTITGTATVSDPSNTENDSQQIANVKYVKRLVGELSQALVFRGTIPIENKIGGMPDSAKVGDVYVVATSGTYETHVCEVGDTMICTSTGTTEWPKRTWVVVEKNIDGAVTAKNNFTNGNLLIGSGGTRAVSSMTNPIEKYSVLTGDMRNGVAWAGTSNKNYVLQTTDNGVEWSPLGTASVPVMSGATEAKAGEQGLVPKPEIADRGKFLCGNGTWAAPTDTNTTYTLSGGDGSPTITLSGSTGVPTKVNVGSIHYTFDDAVGLNGGKNICVVGVAALHEGYSLIPTSLIKATYDDKEKIWHYPMRVTESDISASVAGVLTITPLNNKGNLETIEENLIKYDGSKDIALDAITTGEIDDLFTATPTV